MIAKWRAAVVAGALLLSGCQESETSMPNVPAILVAHDEPPFGDRELARITRGTGAALDLLEPRWGKLRTAQYTVDADSLPVLRQQLRDALPAAWASVEATLPAERGELIVFASGEQLFGVLVVPAPDSAIRPVVLLSNDR